VISNHFWVSDDSSPECYPLEDYPWIGFAVSDDGGKLSQEVNICRCLHFLDILLLALSLKQFSFPRLDSRWYRRLVGLCPSCCLMRQIRHPTWWLDSVPNPMVNQLHWFSHSYQCIVQQSHKRLLRWEVQSALSAIDSVAATMLLREPFISWTLPEHSSS
jgi:hypothetical protein